MNNKTLAVDRRTEPAHDGLPTQRYSATSSEPRTRLHLMRGEVFPAGDSWGAAPEKRPVYLHKRVDTRCFESELYRRRGRDDVASSMASVAANLDASLARKAGQPFATQDAAELVAMPAAKGHRRVPDGFRCSLAAEGESR